MRTIFIGGAAPPFFEGTGPDFPAYDIFAIDDEQVKAIMLRYSIADLLVDLPKRTGPLATLHQQRGEAERRAFLYKDHPTHWLMFIRFENALKASDNGFAMQGMLKSKHTEQDFAHMVAEWFDSTGSGAATVFTPNYPPGRAN